jgi:hypothetical protein
VIITVAFWLAMLSVVFAASVSADDSPGADGARGQQAPTGELSGDDAVGDPAPHVHLHEWPPGQGPSATRDPPVWPPGYESPLQWPWSESEPGHDKCKRWRGYPLPLWCSGLSSWPVLKARAVTAAVPGIRIGGPHPPTRRKHP